MRAFISISVFTTLCLVSMQGTAADSSRPTSVTRTTTSSSAQPIEVTNETLNSRPSSTSSSSSSSSSSANKYLTWSIPTKRADGSTFNRRELGGYYLSVKNLATGGTSQIHISNPDTTSYSLKAFRSGSYAFAIQSYDIDGLKSAYSSQVKVNI